MDASVRYDAISSDICSRNGTRTMDSKRRNLSEFISRNGNGNFNGRQLDFKLYCFTHISQVKFYLTLKPNFEFIFYSSILEAMGTEGGFCFYASFGILGFILIFLLLPETKGVSLDKMDELLSQGWIRGRKEQELNERLTQETANDSEESYE